MLPGLYAHMLNGFLLSVLLIVGLRPIAREVQLTDLPDSRKKHAGEVPLCGGLAIITAFMLSGIGFAGVYRIPWNWEVGFGMLALLGLADDRWQLSAALRLMFQIFIAALLIAGAGTAIFIISRSMGEDVWYLYGPFATIFSVLFIVGTINAVNMLDGLDGVAGVSVAAALFWLALIATHVGHGLIALYALVFVAAVAGFLAFNMRHPWRKAASVFLGDAGSMLLGGAVALFIVHLSSGARGVPFVALIWIVIVPVVDTLSLIVRRIAAGRSPFSPDRWHLHHLLLDIGVPPAMAAVLILGATTLCGAVAYVGIVFGIPDIYLGVCLAVPLLAHTLFVLSAREHLRISGSVDVAAQPIGSPTGQIAAGE